MGAADVVPGVSGGTIAFISGIYEELIATISGVNLSLVKTLKTEGIAAAWKKLNGNFITALFLGIGISVFSLAKGISWLLDNQPILLWSFFFGLVVASIYFVGKSITKWSFKSVILLAIGALAAYYITTLPPAENINSIPYLFFSGALAICAMILPGISGAFILVLLGSYEHILEAVHSRDIKTILIVGFGALFGLLSFAKLLKWMFKHFKNETLALLTGFILGSLNKIWPWKKVLSQKVFGDKVITISEQNSSPFSFEGDSQFLFALVLALFGFSLIFILERIAAKK